MFRNKRKFTIWLVNEAEVADFRTAYRITMELIGGYKSLEAPNKELLRCSLLLQILQSYYFHLSFCFNYDKWRIIRLCGKR